MKAIHGQTHKFNSVFIDFVLEVRENKALKSSGSIIGLTNQDSAFLAWPVTVKCNDVYQRHTVTCKPQKDSNKLRHHSDIVSIKA